MLTSLLVALSFTVGQAEASKKATLQAPVATFGTPTTQVDAKAPHVKPRESLANNSYRIYDEGRPGFAKRLFKAFFEKEEENLPTL